ncbi:MAG: phenylalanine--tRNA ligase subunit beta [Bacilli bacterium]|jgi:phenylalanyl-tRNA synthetase beta chain|nr:phenylalanine--tRNA ligase subunit beta [Bacilli bacterium]
MLFSYKLLSELVDLDGISTEELIRKLTFASFEVENSYKLASADKLVIGHVLSCLKHPDSDHLHVLKVQAGGEGVLDIVCGAPNVKEGENVIVALPGCNLPAISETIKASEIRGYKSNGMCCSLSELGVKKEGQSEEDLNGIHVLSPSAPIGSYEVLKYLGLDDTIIDISILPNRPDCLSHLGMAREISAILDRPFKGYKEEKLPEKKGKINVSSLTSSSDKFALLEVSGLGQGKTPERIASYLRSLGIRSISPIVDLGNFSMVLTGQPLHMYDLDKISGQTLTVKDDFQGEIIALDGKTYKAEKGDIVITDSIKPVCLGGVMGLKAVEVEEKTNSIGIEAAHFYHAAIRHTSARLGLASASSSLFAKGTNPYLIEEALKVTLGLLNEFFPSYKVDGIEKFDQTKPLEGSFSFSLEKLNHRMGASYSKEETEGIIKRLGLSYDGKKILKSLYRLDLNEQCDMDEEIFRLADQKAISLSLDKLPQTNGELTFNQQMIKKIRENLLANGLDELITYTLISKKMDQELRAFDNNPSFKVLHPLTEDHEYIRSDLLSSMKQALEYNLARKHDDLSFFEVSPIDTPTGNHLYLSIGLAGKVEECGMMKNHQADFYDVKGYFEDIMALLGLDERRYTLKRSLNTYFHPGRSGEAFMGKKSVALFGELNPTYDQDGLVLLEMDLSYLLEQKTSKLKLQPTMAFQPIRRDLAFKLLSNDLSAEEIIREIKKAGGRYVSDVRVFDVFQKGDERSYAFALTLYKEDKSFTDAEINSLLNTIILAVTHTLKVELRS